jgi:hypothetical protein
MNHFRHQNHKMYDELLDTVSRKRIKQGKCRPTEQPQEKSTRDYLDEDVENIPFSTL